MFFFALFYHLVIQSDHSEDAIFPRWKRHVRLDKDGTDSQVSKHFKKVWKHLYQKALEYATSMNELPHEDKDVIMKYCFYFMSESLGIHCAKKRGVQDLGDSDLVPQVSYVNKFIF